MPLPVTKVPENGIAEEDIPDNSLIPLVVCLGTEGAEAWRHGFRQGTAAQVIATLFVSPMLIASAKRRLAELHVAAVGAAFENADDPEGDQIVKRLVILEDDTPPPMLPVKAIRRASPSPLPRLHATRSRPIPDPRAPPLA